jgi:hypothetical protein
MGVDAKLFIEPCCKTSTQTDGCILQAGQVQGQNQGEAAASKEILLQLLGSLAALMSPVSKLQAFRAA